jgi:hypothetical protein
MISWYLTFIEKYQFLQKYHTQMRFFFYLISEYLVSELFSKGKTVCHKFISEDPIKSVIFKLLSLSASLDDFRRGHYGIMVIPKNASKERYKFPTVNFFQTI